MTKHNRGNMNSFANGCKVSDLENENDSNNTKNIDDINEMI